MGCASTKHDDLPAVTVDEAIKLRYALAEAHFAYIHSLREIGGSLHGFTDQRAGSSSRKVNLKKLRRRADPAVEKEGIGHYYPRSDSVSDPGSLHHLPVGEADDGYSGLPDKMVQNPVGDGPFIRMNYIMSKAPPPPTVVYYPNPENVFYVCDSSSSHYPYPKADPNPSFGCLNSDYGRGGGAESQFYGSTQPSSSKPPSLPPPSPPRASAWDFLDPFGGDDQSYVPQTRESKKLAMSEEENLPDSEEVTDPPSEMVKEVHEDLKFVESRVLKPAGDKEASIQLEGERREYEVHLVEKKAVDGDKSAAGGRRFGRKGSEAVREIEAEFVRASESGNEVATMLEVGKLPYKHKHVPSKKLGVVPRVNLMEPEEEVVMRSGSLSSTLQKLYLWEKKLYDEVKAEGKLRMVHDKKVRQLERLEGGNADTQKVESIRTLIRDMSTKISMAIQVVDKISLVINKIRDGELWPQIKELIQGLTRMWKRMLECHRVQLQVIRETRGLGPIVSGKKLDDDAYLEATQRLEHELVCWTLSFSDWIDAQRSYVKALNNWLLKCLLYEPEETPEGIAPLSPSKIGAPPIFVICNQWSQTIGRLSEKEVIDSMCKLTMSVLRAWEQDKVELRKRVSGDKDVERKVKMLDREDGKLRKKFRAIEKKMGRLGDDDDSLVVDGNLVYRGGSSRNSLKGGLERIFEAMETFAADSVKAYEELLQRTNDEEERLYRERKAAS